MANSNSRHGGGSDATRATVDNSNKNKEAGAASVYLPRKKSYKSSTNTGPSDAAASTSASNDEPTTLLPSTTDVLITTATGTLVFKNKTKSMTTDLANLQKHWPGNVQFFTWILDGLVSASDIMESQPVDDLSQRLQRAGGRFLVQVASDEKKNSVADFHIPNKPTMEQLQPAVSQLTWQVATEQVIVRFCHEQVSVRRGAAARQKNRSEADRTQKKRRQLAEPLFVSDDTVMQHMDTTDDLISFYSMPMFSIGFNRPPRVRGLPRTARIATPSPEPQEQEQKEVAPRHDLMLAPQEGPTPKFTTGFTTFSSGRDPSEHQTHSSRKRSATDAALDSSPVYVPDDGYDDNADDDIIMGGGGDDDDDHQNASTERPTGVAEDDISTVRSDSGKRPSKRIKWRNSSGSKSNSSSSSSMSGQKSSAAEKETAARVTPPDRRILEIPPAVDRTTEIDSEQAKLAEKLLEMKLLPPIRSSCRRWTKEEDDILRTAVAKEAGPPHNWTKISTDYFGDSRRPLQCKTRWKNALSPDINRSPFTPEEDKLIIEYHSKGYGWPAIVPLLTGRTSEQIRERFVNNIDPSLKTTPWTEEEDQILTDAQKRLGNRWMEIKKELPGRSEMSIKNRWHNRKTKQRRSKLRKAREAGQAVVDLELLTKKPRATKSAASGKKRAATVNTAPAPRKPSAPPSKANLENGQTKSEDIARFKRWTREEDDLLRTAVAKEAGPPHNWKKISTDYFEGKRIPLQCKTRWKNALSPDINRSPFSPEEDKLIIELHQSGCSWPDIVPRLSGRTSEQIRERFVNNIDPSLKTTPWTEEEDQILTEAQQRLGNRWMEIKKCLPGRSEKSIKNRWHNRRTKQRRLIRRMAYMEGRMTLEED